MTLRTVDTNVLIRYLTNDDALQSPIARRFFDGQDDPQVKFFITLPVICESVWLLRSPTFGFDREAISHAFEKLLHSPRFTFQDDDVVRKAFHSYRIGRADFSDYLILQIGISKGTKDVVTFDRSFSRERGVTHLGNEL